MQNRSSDTLPLPASQGSYLAWQERTLVELVGADARPFLHRFCTNDVERLQPSQGCEAFLTTVKGKTMGHLLVSARHDSVVLETVGGQAETIVQHLDRYLFDDRVELIDRSDVWTEWLLLGAPCSEWLRAEGLATPRDVGSSTTGELKGVTVVVTRTPYTLSPSVLVQVDRERADTVADWLTGTGGTVCLPDEFERERIRAGFPWFGRDFDESNLPQELDRNSQAISFTKGCYLGQETVARLDALGQVNKLLRGVIWKADEGGGEGADVLYDDKVVAKLTSVAEWGEQSIGLAILRREAAEPGTQVTVCDIAGTVGKFPLT